MTNRFRYGRHHLTVWLVMMFSLTVYMILMAFGGSFSNASALVIKYILCWVGIIELVYVIVSWHSITGRYFTLYTYFVTFFMMFNYAQCFAWAFGLTGKEEIGKMSLYYRLGIPTDQQIVMTQAIVLISLMCIHLGATLMRKPNYKEYATHTFELEQENDESNCLLSFCMILLPFVVICEYYNLAINIQQARIYGYTALYYSDEVSHANVIIKIVARWFYPTLYGIVIGSRFQKHNKLVIILVALDIILGLAAGDRGGWLYATVMIILIYHMYYKKIQPKHVIIWIVILYFAMSLLIAVRDIRNHGVTIAGLIEGFIYASTNPFGEGLISIGRNMGITTAFVMEGYDIYPYGNTFIYGLITCLSADIKNILHLNYIGPSAWFSQHYLRISNGAGFSIVAEMLLNFGPVLFLFFMTIFGAIVGKITNIENRNINEEPLTVTMLIILTVKVVNISRNAFSTVMGEVVYSAFLFYFGYKLFRGTVWVRRASR